LNDIGSRIPALALRRLAKYAGKDPVFKNTEEAKHYFKTHYADFGPLNEAQWDHLTQYSVKSTDKGYTINVDPGIRNVKPFKEWLSDVIHHPRKAFEGIIYDI